MAYRKQTHPIEKSIAETGFAPEMCNILYFYVNLLVRRNELP
jgi:hypothetical protein